MTSSDPRGGTDRPTDRPGPFGVRGEPLGGSRESGLPVPSDEVPASPTVRAEETAADSSPPAGEDADPREIEELRERIVDTMKTVYDPEIPVNIYELGMVYEIIVEPDRRALVTMTLTSPACPVAGSLPGEVEEKLNEVEGIASGRVELVWDPPWTPERMSEAARLELGMF